MMMNFIEFHTDHSTTRWSQPGALSAMRLVQMLATRRYGGSSYLRWG